MSEKLWAGRFKEKTAKIVETFTSSIDVDKRLYAYDIQGSIAHCRTLAKAAIISAEEAEELIAGLEKIKQEIDKGTLPFSDALEDIHTHIESRLAEIAGKVAHKLHTAQKPQRSGGTGCASVSEGYRPFHHPASVRIAKCSGGPCQTPY